MKSGRVLDATLAPNEDRVIAPKRGTVLTTRVVTESGQVDAAMASEEGRVPVLGREWSAAHARDDLEVQETARTVTPQMLPPAWP